MSRGFVGGFIKRRDGWVGAWVMTERRPGQKRHEILKKAREELVAELADRCGGEAVTRRRIVVVDAICPDGRELLEKVFDAMRDSEQPATDEA